MSNYLLVGATGRFNTDELVENNQASALLVLLGVAYGASITPRSEAHDLSVGLAEVCRLSLFDMIERDMVLCANSTVLSCALVFTILAAWSGDKWLMDIAMGQRGMYFSMLRHSGILDVRPPTTPQMNGNSTMDSLWKDWIQQESRSR